MKKLYSYFYKNLFLSSRLFVGLGITAILFILSFFFTWLGDLPVIAFWVLVILVLMDAWILYNKPDGIFARRALPDRLSNNDDNEITIHVESFYKFNIGINVIDEIPHQFQKRDVNFEALLKPRQPKQINYVLKPTKRGEYHFGTIRIYVRSALGLICRRYNFDQSQMIPVYPSFLQLRKYELMAVTNRLNEIGIKKIRRVGNSMEFEQIKNYVSGDDHRNVNWKATARHSSLMVNTYTEQKSQHIYCVIDKSRAMKMPFEGLSLLDYAINASLVLSSVALIKQDKAGLVTIADKKGAVIPADRKPTQLNKIMEVLYREKTRYTETNMELLYNTVRNTMKQRGLVVFFTNFESLSALKRQLPYLRSIAKYHFLVVVFFENTQLRALSREEASDVEGIYIKTIAEKFVYEKRLIVKELARNGIESILTAPQNLTVNTINRYLQIKAAQRL